MTKINKKVIGVGLAGVMSVAGVAGIVTNQAKAEESKAVADARAKISHTIYSININYARIENQVTWEGYIREARALIAKIPAAEASIADELTAQVDGLQKTVTAIARINHVEKSIRPVSEGGYGNFLGIKNAGQWRIYLEEAKTAMAEIDKSVFQKKYDELASRWNVVDQKVQAIEDKHYADLAAAQALFDEAKKTLSMDDAEKALVEAKKLGTHETSAKLVKEIEDFIASLKAEVVINDVTATGPKTIKITGEALQKITAEAITVGGSEVASVASNGDTKELIVTLKTEMAPGVDIPVTIKVNGVDKKYTVRHELEIKTLEVISQTFAHDKKDQVVGFKVNGEQVSVDYVKLGGYDIKFVGTRTTGGMANIFYDAGNGGTSWATTANSSDNLDHANRGNASTTGVLANNIPLDKITDTTNPTTTEMGLKGVQKVEIQIIKNGAIVVSANGEIDIQNLNEVSKITRVALANVNPSWKTKHDDGTYATADVTYDNNNGDELDEFGIFKAGTGLAPTSAFKMASNTLVTGEVAKIYGVYSDVNGKELATNESAIKVESSNPQVVSVSDNPKSVTTVNGNVPSARFELKAQGPGTATIKVKIGDAEKEIVLNVTNEKRTFKKLELEKTSITTINPELVEVPVKTFDQYGDPIEVITGYGYNDYQWANNTGVGGTAPTPGTDKMIDYPGNLKYEDTIGYFSNSQESDMLMDCGLVDINNKKLPLYEQVFISTRKEPETLLGSGLLTLTNGGLYGDAYTVADLTGKSTKINFFNNYKNGSVLPSKELMGSITVNFTKDNVTTPNNFALKVAKTSNGGSNTVDLATKERPSDEKTLELELFAYNVNGLELGKVDHSKPLYNSYKAVSLNDDIASVDQTSGWSGTTIQVKAKNEGTTDIVVYNDKGVVVAKQKVIVLSEDIKIKSVDFKSIPEITFKNNIIKLEDVMSLETSGYDDIVNGLTLSRNVDAKVRIVKDKTLYTGQQVTPPGGGAAVTEQFIAKHNDLYIDFDNNGKFSKGDKIIGTVFAEVTNDTQGILAGTINSGGIVDGRNAYYNDAKGIITTPLVKAEGEVIVKVSNVKVVQGINAVGGVNNNTPGSVGTTFGDYETDYSTEDSVAATTFKINVPN